MSAMKVIYEAMEVKENVCQLLKWSELQYADFQFESGLTYLSHYLQASWAVDHIKCNRVFWNWWKNHWLIRDKDFLIYVSGSILKDSEMETFYTLLHDGKELSRCIRPSSLVLHDSYASMMQNLIDTTV